MKKATQRAWPTRLTRLIVFVVLLVAKPSYAVDVTLAWDPSEGADHYVVYWDTRSQPPGGYANSLDVGNVTQIPISGLDEDTTYYFVVRAFDAAGNRSPVSREVALIGASQLTAPYDRGWAVTTGDQAGTALQWNSSEATIPTLGSSNDLPGIPGIDAVGVPANLQPSPQSFTTPVKVFIPCPGYSDVGGLNIYYYDGANWVLASNGDTPGTVEPGAAGWMVAGSRVNHSGGAPSTIEIEVYHFSGVQAGTPSGSSQSSGGGGGGCLIATAADGGNFSSRPLIFAFIGIGVVALAAVVGWRRMRSKKR